MPGNDPSVAHFWDCLLLQESPDTDQNKGCKAGCVSVRQPRTSMVQKPLLSMFLPASAKKGDVALQLFSLKLIWAELASKSRQATPIHLRYLFLSYSYLLVDITYLLFYIIDYCTPLVKYENSNNTSCATLSTLCKSSFYVQAKNPGCIADNCLGPSKTACWGWEGEVRITEP